MNIEWAIKSNQVYDCGEDGIMSSPQRECPFPGPWDSPLSSVTPRKQLLKGVQIPAHPSPAQPEQDLSSVIFHWAGGDSGEERTGYWRAAKGRERLICTWHNLGLPTIFATGTSFFLICSLLLHKLKPADRSHARKKSGNKLRSNSN